MRRIAQIVALAFLLLPKTALAAIAPVCQANAIGGASTSITINICDGTSGNVYIAQISYYSAQAINSVPAGWTEIATAAGFDTTGANKVAYYWHRSSGSEPANYQWGFDGNGYSSGGITAYSGAIGSGNPVDVADNNPITVSTTTMTAPSVNTTVANDYIVAGCSLSPTGTTPVGWTGGLGAMNQEYFTAFAAGARYGSSVADVAGPASPGATGTITLTLASSTGVCSQIALQPLSATPTPTATETPTPTATQTPVPTPVPATGGCDNSLAPPRKGYIGCSP